MEPPSSPGPSSEIENGKPVLSRTEGIAKHRENCLHIISFLTSGQIPKGIPYSEERCVRNRARTHVWDAEKNELYYIGTGKNGIMQKVLMTMTDIVAVMKKYHSSPTGGHMGVNRTCAKITKYFTWNGMKLDIQEYVRSCDKCHGFDIPKTQTQAPELQLKRIVVKNPLELVEVELFGPWAKTNAGYTYVLTMTDNFTQFVDFYPLKDKDASSVAQGIKTFMNRWGAPKTLSLDQEEEFVSQINDELCKKLKISWPVISAYNPQTNGLDERFNGTLKSRLSKLCEDQKDDWECFLDDVASSMRTRIHATTKFSPYFLMFGRPARSPYEIDDASGKEIVPSVDSEALDEMVARRDEQITATKKKVLRNIAGQDEPKKRYKHWTTWKARPAPQNTAPLMSAQLKRAPLKPAPLKLTSLMHASPNHSPLKARARKPLKRAPLKTRLLKPRLLKPAPLKPAPPLSGKAITAPRLALLITVPPVIAARLVATPQHTASIAALPQPAPSPSAPSLAVPLQPMPLQTAPPKPLLLQSAPSISALSKTAPSHAASPQPLASKPAPLQPASLIAALSKPVSLQSAPLKPAPLQPASSKPAPLQPASLIAALSKPVSLQPAALQPAPLQPLPLKPAPSRAVPLQSAPSQDVPPKKKRRIMIPPQDDKSIVTKPFMLAKVLEGVGMEEVMANMLLMEINAGPIPTDMAGYPLLLWLNASQQPMNGN